jgi:hypothetical protein
MAERYPEDPDAVPMNSHAKRLVDGRALGERIAAESRRLRYRLEEAEALLRRRTSRVPSAEAYNDTIAFLAEPGQDAPSAGVATEDGAPGSAAHDQLKEYGGK